MNTHGQINADFQLNYNSSSNPANLPKEIEVSGSFIEAVPVIYFKQSYKNDLWFYGSIGAHFLKHNDDLLKDNLNKNYFTGAIGVLYFVTSRHEVGGNLNYNIVDGATINPFNTSGFPFKRKTTNGEIYYRYNGNDLSLSLSFLLNNDDAQTNIFDELANQFEDDNKSKSVSINVEKNFAYDFDLSFSFLKQSTIYDGKVARNANGTINVPQNNPFLEIGSTGLSIALKKKIEKFDVKVEISNQMSEDKIFGAESFDSLAFSADLNYHWNDKVKTNFTLLRSRTNYDNFIALSESPITELDKREDRLVSYIIGVDYEFSKNLSFLGNYQVTSVDSNYRTTSSELAKFDENLFTIGLKLHY